MTVSKIDLMPMRDAPMDRTHILVLTSDFGWVEAWWDKSVKNFWKTREGSASYVSDEEYGDWVSEWVLSSGETDRRLYCGATPRGWMPSPKLPSACSWCREYFSQSWCDNCKTDPVDVD